MSNNQDKQTLEYTGKAVPSSRRSRMASMASLAVGLAGGMISEGAKKISQGHRPQIKDVLLTPNNAHKLANKLKQLRGAALKVGQLLSMDSGEFIPPELAAILAQLRDDVDPMPFSQLTALLNEEWGDEWHEQFKQFSFSPMAAASIGQVHSAHDLNGYQLALKIQYPGVRKSIDSDVDNVGSLLRISGLIPKETDIQYLLEETKKQLHAETDYITEAKWLNQYQLDLSTFDEFIVPSVIEEFTTNNILAMSYHAGESIESLQSLPQDERDHITSSLISLLFNEMFVFKRVQTDPNFANFLYQRDTKKIVLLDFGATRELADAISAGYNKLLIASMDGNKESIGDALSEIGFFQETISDKQRLSVIDIFYQACEPLRHEGLYDFGASNLAQRISIQAKELSIKKNYWHTPPIDALFLHRKIGGLYLIASKLKANINIQRLIATHL